MSNSIPLQMDDIRPPRGAMSLEMWLILAITHRLPRSIKGAGRFAQFLTWLCMRKPRQPVETNILGFQMRLDPSEFLEQVLLFYPQFWDPIELEFLERTLKPGDVFLDVGGHVGLYALHASKAVGSSGRVLTIEASPHTYLKLCYNLRANHVQNVQALNLGVSDKDETLRMNINTSGNQAANSFLFATDEGVEVTCHPLLTILQQQNITRINGAKFDIEGYEYRVLTRFLADADPSLLPDFIILECTPEWIEAAGGNAAELLVSHGYKIHAIHDDNYFLVR